MAAGMDKARAEAVARVLEESMMQCAKTADVDEEMKKAEQDVRMRLRGAAILLTLTVAIVGTGLAAVVLESLNDSTVPESVQAPVSLLMKHD